MGTGSMRVSSGTCPLPYLSVGNLLYPPHRREYEDCKQILKLSLTPTHNVKARARLQPAELSEDLPLWASGIRRLSFWLRSASLHSSRTSILFTVNTRSARLNKSGLETFVFLLRQILRTPRFCLRPKSLRSLCKISSPESQKTPAGLCPSYPHRGRMIAFATAVRSGPSALRCPLDSSFAGI